MELGYKPSPQSEEFRSNAVKQIYAYFMEHMLNESVLRYHRSRDLNYGLTIKVEPEELKREKSSELTEKECRRQAECECLCCHRMIAAARFAPHMEKCIGMGRTSSRVARHRLAKLTSSGPSSASQSPRVGTRVSTCSALDDVDGEDEPEEDDEWSNSSTPIKKRRTVPSKPADRRRQRSSTCKDANRTR